MGGNPMPVISKMFCSSSKVVLGVRRRPHVVNGGGFVVTDMHTHNIVFKVDGCGVSGRKDELIVSDGDQIPLLLIRRKGGIVEALSITKHWEGLRFDYEGSQKLVFTLEDHASSCLAKNSPIRISVNQMGSGRSMDFEIRGHFPDRECSIIDSAGNVIAQVGVSKELKQVLTSKDLYHVLVMPGIDQAFVVGVIAILDYIYDGTTRC